MALYINGVRQDAVALNLAHTWLANQTFNDNVKLLLGTGIDAALYYDGSHLYIDPKEVGSGRVKILGDLDLTPDAESGTPSTTGAWLNQTAQTFTDNATAAAGTVAAMVFNSVQIPIFDALNGAAGANRVTATDSATWYIAGPPAPVTDKTLITNPWALWVDAGRVRLDDQLEWGVGVAVRAASYSIGRNADGTNLLQLNVPTGASFEWSGNDVARMTLTAAGTLTIGTITLASDEINTVSGSSLQYKTTGSGTFINFEPDATGGGQIKLTPGTSQVILLGGRVIKSSSATEIGLQVTNGTLTVGSEGSIEAPYLSQAAAAFTDAIGGNLDGCIGINHDSSPGADTIEVRVEGSWLSVAVAGYLIQNTVPYTASPDIWVHPNQVKDGKWLDETVCIVCGEQMNPKDAISMYGNYWAGKRGLHAIFGHQHLERDSYIQKLAARVKELEARVPVAA